MASFNIDDIINEFDNKNRAFFDAHRNDKSIVHILTIDELDILKDYLKSLLGIVQNNHMEQAFLLLKDRIFNDIFNKVYNIANFDYNHMSRFIIESSFEEVKRLHDQFLKVKENLLFYFEGCIGEAQANYSSKASSGNVISAEITDKALSVEKLLKTLYTFCNLDDFILNICINNPGEFKDICSHNGLDAVKNNSDVYYKVVDPYWKKITDKFSDIYVSKDENGNNVVVGNDFLKFIYCCKINRHTHSAILECLPDNVKTLVKYELATGSVRKSFHLSDFPSKENFYQAVDYFLANYDFDIESTTKDSLKTMALKSNTFDRERYKVWASSPDTRDFLAEFACSVYTVLRYELDLYKDKNNAPLFSQKELNWMMETARDETNYNELMYYCTFLKKYIRDKDFSYDLEKFARINKLFTTIKNVNDVSVIADEISKWFSSIRVEDLTHEELEELKVIDFDYFISSLSYQDRVVYEMCNEYGIEFELYYKKFNTELIREFGPVFRGSNIPLSVLTGCFEAKDSKSYNGIPLYAEKIDDIKTIVKYFSSYDVPLDSIPDIIYSFSSYDVLSFLNSQFFGKSSTLLEDFSSYIYCKEHGLDNIDEIKGSNIPALFLKFQKDFEEKHPFQSRFSKFKYELSIKNNAIATNYLILGVGYDLLVYNLYYLKQLGFDAKSDDFPVYYLKEQQLEEKLELLEGFYPRDKIPENIMIMNLDKIKDLIQEKSNDNTFWDFISINGSYETISNNEMYKIYLLLKDVKVNSSMVPLSVSDLFRNMSLYKEYLKNVYGDFNVGYGDWLLYKWPGEFKRVLDLCHATSVFPYKELFYFDSSLLENREFFAHVINVLNLFRKSNVQFDGENALNYQRSWLLENGQTLENVQNKVVDIEEFLEDSNEVSFGKRAG